MVTAELTPLEAKEQELQATKVEFSEAQAIANQEITELLASNPTYDLNLGFKMAEISKPVATLQAKIDRLTKEFDKLNESNRLEATQSMRDEVTEVIKEQLADTQYSVSMIGVTGTAKLVDGKWVVQLNPQFSALDLEGPATIIASQMDPKAFADASLTNMAIGVKDGVVSFTPLGKTSTGTRKGGTKSKSKEFFAGGKWLSNKEFLKLILDSGDTYAQTHANAFNGAINSGSNVYVLAIETAERLGVEMRDKVRAPKAA